MFNRKTLFVIGAGAGHDIKVPAGRQLAEDIARRTEVILDDTHRLSRGAPDPDLVYSFYGRNDGKWSSYHSAFRLIHRGVLLANSIDDFLNIHEGSPEVVTVGKAAIVRAILEAERRCKLYVDPSNIYNTLDISPIRDSWFVKFMQVLGPGQKVHDVENVLSDVSFITFNYDRCLEFFLRHGLQLLYGIQSQQAVDIVAKAKIIHPYGSVGPLDKVPFGGTEATRMDYRELSKAVKTYTERIEEQEVLQSIGAAIREAQCIVFLGFAYHKQNMALLSYPRSRKIKQIYGTAYGLSDSDVEEVANKLGTLFPDSEDAADDPSDIGLFAHSNIRLENKLTCAQLFEHYAKSIAG
jgi:hypothetical protein